MGQLVAHEGVSNNAIFASELADVWMTYLGLDWLGAQLIFIVLLFQPF